MSNAPTGSLERGLRILSALKGRNLEGMTNKALAEATQLAAPTVSRLLQTLISEGYVKQLENGRYALSTKMLGLAQALWDELDRGQGRINELKQGVMASARQ